MIKTQCIKSTSSKIIPVESFTPVNVLKWKNSKYASLSPYYLKTDGLEVSYNPGGVIFENWWQGSKVYPIVYSNDVYAGHYFIGNPKYLWWSYKTESPDNCDVIINPESPNDINTPLYMRWRTSIFACPNPIRYPNKRHLRSTAHCAVVMNKNGEITKKLDYITARKEMYYQEYARLVKKLPEYTTLLDKLRRGENILIAEVDVPAKGKKGEYGIDVDNDGVSCTMSIEKNRKVTQ